MPVCFPGLGKIACWMKKEAEVMEAGLVLARLFSQLHGWGELIVVFFPFIIMNDII